MWICGPDHNGLDEWSHSRREATFVSAPETAINGQRVASVRLIVGIV